MNLRRSGYHVIHAEKLRGAGDQLSVTCREVGMISLLQSLKREDAKGCYVIRDFDDFLKTSSVDSLETLRTSFNQARGRLMNNKCALIFVTSSKIENAPDDPRVGGKSLSLVFPRPHELGAMEPQYLFYPF